MSKSHEKLNWTCASNFCCLCSPDRDGSGWKYLDLESFSVQEAAIIKFKPLSRWHDYAPHQAGQTVNQEQEDLGPVSHNLYLTTESLNSSLLCITADYWEQCHPVNLKLWFPKSDQWDQVVFEAFLLETQHEALVCLLSSINCNAKIHIPSQHFFPKLLILSVHTCEER